MLRRVCYAALAVTLVSTAQPGRAQSVIVSGDIPLRAAAPPPHGTGLIAGRVVDAESRRPVAGAAIYAALSGPMSSYEPVLTDEQGRFVLRDLPKGAFLIRAWRQGYVDGAYARATPVVGNLGEPFTLADDERVGDVVIRMWKFAAIGGAVTDEAGEPMVGVTVRALARRVVNGRRVVSFEQMQGYTDTTDDRGMYRIAGLAPGEYIVVVPVTSASWPKSLARLTASTPGAGGPRSDLPTYSTSRWLQGGSSGGGPGSLIEVGDEAFAIAHRETFGGRMGGSPLVAGVRPDGTLLVYETQFYPGAATMARASVIKLGSGAEQSGVDFRLQPAPASPVSGVVTGPDGPARDLAVRLVHADTLQMTADPETSMTATDENGRFTFLGIPPGQYVVRILKAPRTVSTGATELTQSVRTGSGAGGGISIIEAAPRTLPNDPTWWAEAPVTVGDRPVDGVSLSLREGIKLSGRVEFVGSAPRTDLRGFGAVYIERADGSPANTTTTYSLRYGRIDGQGNLSTYGQVPGQYFVRVSGAPPGWYFAGAMLGGRDLSVTPIELKDAHIEGVVLRFSDTPLAEISGAVVLDRTAADPEATVVVFPTSPAMWTNVGDTPRNLRSVGVTRGNRYVVGNLPPGDYYVAAVAGPPPSLDVATLERLAKQAARLTVAASEKKVQDVRIAPARAPMPDDEEIGHGPFVPDDDQAQAPPARDARPGPPAGTGVISGVILSMDATPRPIRRATVSLAGAALLGGRTVITDDTGRFVFTAVPAGRYTLQASKPAHIFAVYGAPRPGGSGTAITLADGQRMTDVTLKLARGAVIAGTIRDEHGQPASGVTVEAERTQNTATGPRRLQSGSATTDDRGHYRIFGLNAGEYFIKTSPRLFTGANAQPTRQADLDFGAAALKGRAASPAPPTPPRRPSVGLATVFYPGTTMADAAQKIVVAAGEERTGIDMALQLVPTVWVDGTVSNPAGPLPSNLEIRLTAIDAVNVSADFYALLPQRPGPNGEFSFSGVAPGLYVASAVTSLGGRGAAPATSLWATAEVQVQGSDVHGVALSLQPGMAISGRVQFDGTTGKPPADLTTVRVSLQPVLTGSQIAVGPLSIPVSADGTFTTRGVMPGKYRLSALVSGGAAATGGVAWTTRSAMVGGVDALDLPFEVRGGSDVAGVELTFTDRTIELTGTLTDAAGKPAPEHFLIAFAADRNLWGVPRRVTQARPSTDGRFTIRALRPGDYFLAAVTDLDPGAITDPELLEGLVASAIKITLAEGDKKVQDIRIGGK
jgi:protocatechuate 3,4-dioxygenase beta subunit